jgi:hypothetical protein
MKRITICAFKFSELDEDALYIMKQNDCYYTVLGYYICQMGDEE